MGNADTKGPYSDDRSSHLTLTRSSEPGKETPSSNTPFTWTAGEAVIIMNHNEGADTLIMTPWKKKVLKYEVS